MYAPLTPNQSAEILNKVRSQAARVPISSNLDIMLSNDGAGGGAGARRRAGMPPGGGSDRCPGGDVSGKNRSRAQ